MDSFYSRLSSQEDKLESSRVDELKDWIHSYPDFSRAYVLLYELLVREGRYLEADVFFRQSLKFPDGAQNSYWMLARLHARSGKNDQAFKQYLASLKVDRRPPTRLLIDYYMFLKQSKFSDSSRTVVEGDFEKRNPLLVHAIRDYVQLDFAAALKGFSRLSMPEQLDLDVIYCWGNAHKFLQQYQEAEELWRHGLLRARIIGDMQFDAKFLMALGVLSQARGDRNAAFALFDSAHVVAHSMADHNIMEYVAGNKAIIYTQMGEFKRAERLFLEAIESAKKLKSDWKLAVWYNHFGRLFHHRDKFDDALKYYSLSTQHAEKASHDEKIIQNLLSQADLYRAIQHFDLAKTYSQRALSHAETNHLVALIEYAHLQKADLFVASAQYDSALHALNRYLLEKPPSSRNPDVLARCYLLLGRIFHQRQQFDQSLHFFQKSIETADSIQYDYVKTWALIGRGHSELALEDFSSAQSSFLQALTLAESKQDNSTLPAIYAGVADCFSFQQDLKHAIPYYRQAIAIIEMTRLDLKNPVIRGEYFSNVTEIYDKLLECYVQSYSTTRNVAYLDSVVMTLEMTRGRLLHELLRHQKLSTVDLSSSQYFADYDAASQRLQQKQRELRLKSDLLSNAEFTERLAELHATQFSLKSQRLRLLNELLPDAKEDTSTLRSVDQLARLAGASNLGILLYHVSGKKPFVLAVTADDQRLFFLPTSAESIRTSVDSLIAPFHKVTQKGYFTAPFYTTLAHQLYRWLLFPVISETSLPQNILVVPDEEIANLPFEMLLRDQQEQDAYYPGDKAAYWPALMLHEYNFVYSPTTALLEATSGPALSSPRIAIYANPFEKPALLANNAGIASSLTGKGSRLRKSREESWPLTPLPFAEVEGERIYKTVDKAQLYTNGDASEKAFLATISDYDIHHFATHAFINDDDDLFSGLVLAASDSVDDGLLMGYEISGMDLDCDCIVLSACETARGRMLTGEGTLGLPRLFLTAGAKSVLMTLWKVDDHFSAALMPDFYQLLLGDKMTKVEALATAKRNVAQSANSQKEYQHPVFWAAFTLYGNPGISGHQTSEFLGRLRIAAVISGLLGLVVLVGFFSWQLIIRRGSYAKSH